MTEAEIKEPSQYQHGVPADMLVEAMGVLAGLVIELEHFDERGKRSFEMLEEIANELISRSRLVKIP